jgi:hypothetical protein
MGKQYSLELDGCSYLTTVISGLYDLSIPSFTIEGWVNVSDQNICNGPPVNYMDGYYFLGNINTQQRDVSEWSFFGKFNDINFCQNSNTTNQSAYAEYNNWYHFAAVKKPYGPFSKIYYFFNGGYYGSMVSYGCPAASTIGIGATADGQCGFIGKLSNIRIITGQSLYDSNFSSYVIPNAPLELYGYGNCQNVCANNVVFLGLKDNLNNLECYGNPLLVPDSPWANIKQNLQFVCGPIDYYLTCFTGGFPDGADCSFISGISSCKLNGSYLIYKNNYDYCFCSFNYCESGYKFFNEESGIYNIDIYSDGNGGYINNTVYKSGYRSTGCILYIEIPELGYSLYENGILWPTADGKGGCNDIYEYNCYGWTYYTCTCAEFSVCSFISDSTGGYLIIPSKNCTICCDLILQDCSGAFFYCFTGGRFKKHFDVNLLQTSYYDFEYSGSGTVIGCYSGYSYVSDGCGSYNRYYAIGQLQTCIINILPIFELNNCFENGYRWESANGLGGSKIDSICYQPFGYCFTGSGIDNFYSNGSGDYYINYYSGQVLECKTSSFLIPGIGCINNGVYDIVSDGKNGSGIGNTNYCDNNFVLACSGNFEIKSDGDGYYFINELNYRQFHCGCINWDFSAATKIKYFGETIQTNGTDLFISFNEKSCLFNEVNVTSPTDIYITEQYCKCAFKIKDVNKPFIYLRNIGYSCLCIKSSNGSTACFQDYKIIDISSFCKVNILLHPKESVILYINSTQDGSCYYSTACYPFGYYYKFTNINEINPFGLYPSCSILNENTDIQNPIFAYEKINGINSTLDFYNTDSGYLESYQKIRSYYSDLIVDDNSNLEISFCKNYYLGNCQHNFEIHKNFEINSLYNFNIFKSCFCTNSVCIVDNNGTYNINDSNLLYSKIINSNFCISVIYDIDLNYQKEYCVFYIDKNSGDNSYDLCLLNISKACIFNKNYLCTNSGIKINANDSAYVSIDICNKNLALKDLQNKNILRNNLYLPPYEEFSYNYYFELNCSDYLTENAYSGDWTNLEIQNSFDCVFINCSNIISSTGSEYEYFKSKIYCLNLNFDTNCFNTNNIQEKNSETQSDNFCFIYMNCERSFYFCCFEFKYNPISSIIVNNCYFDIPDCNTFINIKFNENYYNIEYPLNALSENLFKAKSSLDIFDESINTKLNINYNGFNFYLSCDCSNLSNFKFPIIQCETKDGYESPEIYIQNSNIQKIKSNLDFFINPFNSLENANFDLNNYLLFVNSALTTGIASCLIDGYYYKYYNLMPCVEKIFSQDYIQCCAYLSWIDPIYGGNEYCFNNGNDLIYHLMSFYSEDCFLNFNMQWSDIYQISGEENQDLLCVDVCYKNYFNNNCQNLSCDYPYSSTEYNLLMIDLHSEYSCKKNQVTSIWGHLLNNINSISSLTKNSFIPYKNITGSGYNYIIPLACKLNYYDYLFSGNCQINNYENSISGNLNFVNTGFCFSDSNFKLLNNNEFILISKNDIDISNLYRCICISKDYAFSGIQPINIYSNYNLLDIKYPIVSNTFKLYCDSCNTTGDIYYYYMYNITGFKKDQIKIISPEFTDINYICWTDQDLINKNITYLSANEYGIILKNSSKINFNISDLIYNNNYFYNCLIPVICINIMGGL